MRFRTVVELGGKTATGMQVPDEVVAEVSGGKRAPVRITVGGHAYRTTLARMGGRWLVPLSAENRGAAGVAAGDAVEVEIEADASERTVEVPEDLAAALAGEQAARDYFDGLAYTHRKEWVRWVEEAKRPETRARRVTTTVERLREGRPTR